MKKILIIILLLFGCQANEIEILFHTDSSVPQDTDATYDTASLDSKAERYLDQIYPVHYDEYDLLLPYDVGLSEFKDQGDAAAWNSVSLASLCMLNASGMDVTDDIDRIWASIKTNIQMPEGYLIRHPDRPDTTTISRDHMTLWLMMGAMAFDTDCPMVKDEFGSALDRFIVYGREHNWQFDENEQTLSTTMTNRHKLHIVSNLYELGWNEENLAISTSIDDIERNAALADWINENYYKCNRLSDAGACRKLAGASVFGNHLFFETSVIYAIGQKYGKDPYHDDSTVKNMLRQLARVGDSIDHNNWLFVAGYRHFYYDTPTYNDISRFLDLNFPDNLPTEKVGVSGWGCTDFLWQRVPGEYCNQASTIEYIGADFMLAYAYTKL